MLDSLVIDRRSWRVFRRQLLALELAGFYRILSPKFRCHPAQTIGEFTLDLHDVLGDSVLFARRFCSEFLLTVFDDPHAFLTISFCRFSARSIGFSAGLAECKICG